MKVLLFSNDTMPFGPLPTSGGGLRCWQIYQGLKSKGVEVIASMPAFTYLTKKYYDVIPDDVRANLWEWHTQDEIYERIKPDAVIFASNWDHYNLSSKPKVPLIQDLHGSRLIETSMWGESADRNKKVRVFSQADCLLCAGRKQQKYFYGWLMQAGRVVPSEEFIRYIPISLSPETFERNTSDAFPTFVSGGGWFPWQDQSEAIFRIAKEVINRNDGYLKIYGTPHDNSQNLSPEELHIRSIFNKIKSISEEHDRVQVEGYVGREELLDEYSKAHIAVELMQYNLERELAFTTRTIEYLWCGLPVLYNHYSEISGHIADYDAGWTVDPKNPEQLEQALHEMFTDPDLVLQKSKNAQKLVVDRFSWDKTIEPLYDFLENAQVREATKPAWFLPPTHAPYLYPRGEQLSIALEKESLLEQEVLIPAEGVWGIQVYPQSCIDGIFHVKVKNELGVTIGRTTVNSKSENLVRGVLIPFTSLLKPKGGSIVRIYVERIEGDAIDFTGYHRAVYPLRDLFVTGTERKKIDSVLKVDFLQGPSRLLHYKNLLFKGVSLLREGDWVRVKRAIRRRVPLNTTRVIQYGSRIFFGNSQNT